jgi:hypothetical protein
MYEFTVSGNYLLVTYIDNTKTLYQFPMIKTVYSFNGKVFKISEGEIMADNLLITVDELENGKVIDDKRVAFTETTFQVFLQQKTAIFK